MDKEAIARIIAPDVFGEHGERHIRRGVGFEYQVVIGAREDALAKATAILALQSSERGEGRPLDMLLFCPRCHVQHVDEPDERTPEWDNPPHRSHLCHACGCIWRPADVPTNGVREIETRGKADTWATLSPAEPSPESREGIISGYADLPVGWDSYSAKPMPRDFVPVAHAFARWLPTPDRTVPLPDGGIGFRWDGPDLEIDLAPDGTFEGSFPLDASAIRALKGDCHGGE